METDKGTRRVVGDRDEIVMFTLSQTRSQVDTKRGKRGRSKAEQKGSSFSHQKQSRKTNINFSLEQTSAFCS